MSSKRYWIVLLLIAAFSIWLRAGFPLSAIPAFQHDDLLFIRLARFLEGGQWLGPYDNLTLAKGMFYPLFIVITFWTSVPLKIAEQIVYLVVSAATAETVKRIAGNARLGLFLFALLAFNPVSWNVNFARVLRQGLYLSLSLAVVTLVVVMVFPSPSQTGHAFRHKVLPGVCLGLVGAAYWLTREEGVWLLPAIAVVIAVALLGIVRPTWARTPDSQFFPDRSTHLKAIALPLVLALVVFTGTDWLVAGLNYRHYGIFETNEFRTKSFLHAYGAISRIKPDHWRPYVIFPKDARQHSYAVSPAARELALSFEGALGNGWLQTACRFGTLNPCDEVQTGWFMWELRDAVAAAGHYHSGAEAMRFYERLAEEIDLACAKGLIQCLPPRATLQPPFRWEYLTETRRTLNPVTKAVLTMADGPVGDTPSNGTEQGLALFADTVDGIYLPERQPIVVDGWAASLSATPKVELVSLTADQAKFAVNALPATDVLVVFPNFKAMRFELKTDCPISNCDFVVDVPGSGQTRIPLATLAHPGAVMSVSPSSGLMVFVDSVAGLDTYGFQESRRTLQEKIADRVALGYAHLFPILAGIGAVGLMLATFFRWRCPLPIGLLALGLASAAAVATLTVLLAYLDASGDWPAVASVLYTSPASPFVITYTTLGVYSWYIALKQWALRGAK